MSVFDGSCVELTKVNADYRLFSSPLLPATPRDCWRVGYDVTGKHLLDLRHLFPPNSWVLSPIRLSERRPVGLDRVLQGRSAAKVVLSLAKHIAELLEEAVQLLLLEQ